MGNVSLRILRKSRSRKQWLTSGLEVLRISRLRQIRKEIIMDLRGIVLAGGTGSRLRPLTKVTNKHLLPVGQKPMIFYPIEKLAAIGIEEILIVTGIEHMGDVVSLLGSGKNFGCRFTYKVQSQKLCRQIHRPAGRRQDTSQAGTISAAFRCCRSVRRQDNRH